MQNAALHNSRESRYIAASGGQTGRGYSSWVSEPNSSPDHARRKTAKYRAALALLHAMSNADRADIGVKPADFPRLAREMALK